MAKRRPSFKGHCALCAMNKGAMIRGCGWTPRMRASHRRAYGRSRRIGRHEIPADQLPRG